MPGIIGIEPGEEGVLGELADQKKLLYRPEGTVQDAFVITRFEVVAALER